MKRTEALRAAGIHQSELLSTQGTGFVVAHCDIHYRQPAALDDLLSVETRLSHLKKVRLQMHQTIRRDSIDLVHLIVDIAMVDRDRKPARIPDEIIHALKTHMPTTS